jgi:LysM repeat protein
MIKLLNLAKQILKEGGNVFGTTDSIEKDNIREDSIFPSDSISKLEFPLSESKPIEKKEIKKKKTLTKNYRVKSGDTLSEIADKFNTTVSKIKKTNQLKSDNLQIGLLLKIPK